MVRTARAWLLALGLLSTALVGCLSDEVDLGNETDETEIPPEQRSRIFQDMVASNEAHDHASPAHHNVSFQMDQLDHLALAEPGEASGVHALAIRGDTIFASSTLGENPGFAVVDVSDPTNMTVLGEWRSPTAVGGDRSIAVSEDAQYVFLANEGDVQAQEPGVRVIDASDPASMEEVAYMPMDSGAHTVETITIDGTIYVFALNYGVQTFRLVEAPTGVSLVKVGQYTFAGDQLTNPPDYDNEGDYVSWGLRAVYAHDMRAVHDPELGPLLYIAYAYQGLHVLDINAPEAPQLLTTWVPQGDGAPWYTHTVEAAWIDDRRVVVVGSEVFEDRHLDTPSPIWVLDLTDMDAPDPLRSTWVNPAGAGADELLFSAHFFRIEDGYVHLSHYHGGVWVLDITTQERQADPAIVGAILPHEETGFRPDAEDCCLGWNLAGIPVVMDAVAKDGVTFAADLQTGLYALQADPLAR